LSTTGLPALGVIAARILTAVAPDRAGALRARLAYETHALTVPDLLGLDVDGHAAPPGRPLRDARDDGGASLACG
jgi:hypothetical protein